MAPPPAASAGGGFAPEAQALRAAAGGGVAPVCGLFILLGADRFRKHERLAQLRQSLKVHPLDEHRLSALALDPADFGTLIREHPALSPMRLIVVEDAHRLSPGCLKGLEHHRDVLKQVACVFLLSDAPLEPSHPLLALKPFATVESFEEPGRSKSSGGFALLEAVARRDVAAALHLMQDQLAEGKEVVELFGLLGWQLQRWLTVSHLVDAGMTPRQIADVTGLSSWQVERITTELAGRRTEELARVAKRCWEADVEVKTGRTIPRMALERLLVELCLPAPAWPVVA